jgi:uncharacterized protein (DUF885 family)
VPLALLVAFGAGTVAAQEQPAGDARLVGLGARYFSETWRLDPIRATETGVHDYDDRLPDSSAAGYSARISFARKLLSDLRAIDPTTYGAEGSYDARLLEGRLQSTLIALQERETWKHNPALYSGQAASAVFSLLARDYAPLRDRLKSVIGRERLIPALLDDGRQNVTSVDATTAQLAKAEIAGSKAFFEHVVPAAFADLRDARLQAEFGEANRGVVAALDAYQSAMDAGPLAHPSGTYAIGSALFARLLEIQELAPITPADYERAGDAALAQTKADFTATAKLIDPAKPAQEVAAELGARHPTAGDLLKTARQDVVALRSFVIAHKIVTLPGDDDVKVVSTPEFARETTFASMDEPGALEKVATEAFYNVTPADPSWPAQRREQHLEFFNDYAFPIVSLHEVYPGHYANFAIDRHLRLSQIRRLIVSGSFAEGWAHYDEQMMVDEGWGNGDPHVRLAQLQLALQRECRLVVGLREHTQGMSVDAGTRFFEENAFMSHEPAHREALRGTQDPLYGYYTLGKLEILKLRDDYKAKYGRSYTLEGFHDALLAHGDPPVSILRKTLLGADDDGKLF